jgi:hypothetical protein
VERVQGGTRRKGSNNYFYWHLKQALIRWVNGTAAAASEREDVEDSDLDAEARRACPMYGVVSVLDGWRSTGTLRASSVAA